MNIVVRTKFNMGEQVEGKQEGPEVDVSLEEMKGVITGIDIKVFASGEYGIYYEVTDDIGDTVPYMENFLKKFETPNDLTISDVD